MTAEARTVLVADDTEDMRSLLQVLLRHAGFDVVLAEDGPQALERWREADHPPYAVILDHRMPGMTGMEVAGEILQEQPDARVILFSAQLDDQMREEADALGVRACLTKMEVSSLLRHPAMQPVDPS